MNKAIVLFGFFMIFLTVVVYACPAPPENNTEGLAINFDTGECGYYSEYVCSFVPYLLPEGWSVFNKSIYYVMNVSGEYCYAEGDWREFDSWTHCFEELGYTYMETEDFKNKYVDNFAYYDCFKDNNDNIYKDFLVDTTNNTFTNITCDGGPDYTSISDSIEQYSLTIDHIRINRLFHVKRIAIYETPDGSCTIPDETFIENFPERCCNSLGYKYVDDNIGVKKDNSSQIILIIFVILIYLVYYGIPIAVGIAITIVVFFLIRKHIKKKRKPNMK